VEKFHFEPRSIPPATAADPIPARWRFTPTGNTRGTLVPAVYEEPDGEFLFFAGSIPGTASLLDLNFFTDWLFGGATDAELERHPTLFRYTLATGRQDTFT